MMKTILTSGVALALLAGGALAQAAPPPAPAGMTPPPTAAAPPPAPADVTPPPAAPPRPVATRAPAAGPATFDDGGPGAPPPEDAGRHRPPPPPPFPPPPPPPKGARIHLQRGDTVLDVTCADDEPMKTCADLTLQMLDRLQGPKT